MIWVFIVQGSVTAAIGAAAGWCGRGWWDAPAADIAQTETEGRSLFTDEDWAEIEALANGGTS